MAAIRKDNTTAGPAMFLETFPARTYTPSPSVLPTPRAVRSKVLSTRARSELPSVRGSSTLRRHRACQLQPLLSLITVKIRSLIQSSSHPFGPAGIKHDNIMPEQVNPKY